MKKTKQMKPAQMEPHIGRFRRTRAQKHGSDEKAAIPPAAWEMLAADQIFYMLGPKDTATAVGGGVQPAAVGDPGLTVYVVKCPAGNGPLLHAHMQTREIFMPITGRWELTWGDRGEHSTVLEPCDVFAVPQGVMRKFKNVADHEALLLVTIQGTGDFEDIGYAPEVGAEVARRFGPQVKTAFEQTGITFDAQAG